MGDTLSWSLVVTDKSDTGIQNFGKNLEKAESKAKAAAKKIGVGLGVAGGVAAGLFAKGFADDMEIQTAQAKLKAQLNLSKDDAAKAGAASAEVYGSNFGESIDQVNDSIKAVGTNITSLSKLSKAQITDMSESALTLSQAFDIDVADSTRAVGALMKNGLAKNAKEAFDIITAGEQNGVDKAGDLLDTITEYSPQFSKLGITGKDALDLLSRGLKAGARDTDTIADGFKEFSLRAIDGSALTAQGFKAVGLNAKTMAEEIAKGGPAAREATQQTLEGLLKIKDPVKQNTAGVALFGTQWEDTVRQILPALANTKDGIKDVDGSTQAMADTMGGTAQARIDGMKRKFEQWTQGMASSDSALGTVVTGVMAAAPALGGLASQLGVVAVALKGTAAAEAVTSAATSVLSGALTVLKAAWVGATGPVGLLVVGVVALGVALVVAYKKSETFRNVVNSVFRSVANFVLKSVGAIISVFGKLFGVMGHLPGKAGAAFRSAERSARSAKAEIDRVRASINAVKSKTVTIKVTTVKKTIQQRNDAVEHLGHLASGGPAIANRPYIVGEEGPELVIPRANAEVFNAAKTALLRGGKKYGINAPVMPGMAAALRVLDSLKPKVQEYGIHAPVNPRNSPKPKKKSKPGSTSTIGDGETDSGGDVTINVIVQGSLLATAAEIRKAVIAAFKVAPAGTPTLIGSIGGGGSANRKIIAI